MMVAAMGDLATLDLWLRMLLQWRRHLRNVGETNITVLRIKLFDQIERSQKERPRSGGTTDTIDPLVDTFAVETRRKEVATVGAPKIVPFDEAYEPSTAR
jgi:hypothetical protein